MDFRDLDKEMEGGMDLYFLPPRLVVLIDSIVENANFITLE